MILRYDVIVVGGACRLRGSHGSRQYGRENMSRDHGYEQDCTDELQPCHWRHCQRTNR